MVWLIVVAEPGDARIIAAVYGLLGVGLFSVSAAAHYRLWDPRRLHLLFQLDHSMIMVFITGTTAPMAYAVGGGTGWVLFGGMVLGAGLGVVAIWLPFHPPRGFMNTLFFIVAWWPILFTFPLQRGLGGGGLVILLAGGAVYSLGALIVGFQRPDPNPNVFGYHEIWHLFVIAGYLLHFVLVYLILSGQAPVGL